MKKKPPTSLRTALKRPLLVLVLLVVEEVFLKPPYLASVLLLIVSALSLGASPSTTKTSFTPMSVRDETLKNKFLHTEVSRLKMIRALGTMMSEGIKVTITSDVVC